MLPVVDQFRFRAEDAWFCYQYLVNVEVSAFGVSYYAEALMPFGVFGEVN